MSKLKVVSFVGYIEDSSYISIITSGNKRQDSIGDIAWCAPSCSSIEVAEWISGDDLKEFLNWFENPKSVKRFLRRMGVDMD